MLRCWMLHLRCSDAGCSETLRWMLHDAGCSDAPQDAPRRSAGCSETLRCRMLRDAPMQDAPIPGRSAGCSETLRCRMLRDAPMQDARDAPMLDTPMQVPSHFNKDYFEPCPIAESLQYFRMNDSYWQVLFFLMSMQVASYIDTTNVSDIVV